MCLVSDYQTIIDQRDVTSPIEIQGQGRMKVLCTLCCRQDCAFFASSPIIINIVQSNWPR